MLATGSLPCSNARAAPSRGSWLLVGALLAGASPSCSLLSSGAEAPRGSVGAVLAKVHSDGRVFVRSVPADLAAEQGGLSAGDEILLLDGRDVRRMSPNEIHLASEGEVGSTVRLTVWRDGRVERMELKRTALRPVP